MTGPAGDHWLAYHAWKPGAIGYDSGGARSVRFASLTWHANQLVVTGRALAPEVGDAHPQSTA